MKLNDSAMRVKELRKKRGSRKVERKRHSGRVADKSLFLLLRYFIVIFIFLGLYLVANSKTKYWDGKEKFSVVINTSGGTVSLVTFDPARGEIESISIPSNTQVDVARGLGRWKLKSIWKLGEEENVDGFLLAETLTHSLKLPVYIWADNPAEGLASRNLIKVLRAVFLPYKTNMGVGDRVRIALFNLSIKNSERGNINLADTAYLKEATLDDGSMGYVVTAKYPTDLLSIFSDEKISQNSIGVVINDYSGSYNTADALGQIIEILGAKTAAINREELRNFDCEVAGNELLVNKIILLFGCKKVGLESGSIFDVDLKIGSDFVKDF